MTAAGCCCCTDWWLFWKMCPGHQAHSSPIIPTRPTHTYLSVGTQCILWLPCNWTWPTHLVGQLTHVTRSIKLHSSLCFRIFHNASCDWHASCNISHMIGWWYDCSEGGGWPRPQHNISSLSHSLATSSSLHHSQPQAPVSSSQPTHSLLLLADIVTQQLVLVWNICNLARTIHCCHVTWHYPAL